MSKTKADIIRNLMLQVEDIDHQIARNINSYFDMLALRQAIMDAIEYMVLSHE